MYDPSKDDIYLSVSESKDAWYFDRGGSKHITSWKKFFVTLEDVCHTAGIVTCANNASYIIKGFGHVHITAINGNVVTLNNVLYVPGIKKTFFQFPPLLCMDILSIFSMINAQYMIVQRAISLS